MRWKTPKICSCTAFVSRAALLIKTVNTRVPYVILPKTDLCGFSTLLDFWNDKILHTNKNSWGPETRVKGCVTLIRAKWYRQRSEWLDIVEMDTFVELLRGLCVQLRLHQSHGLLCYCSQLDICQFDSTFTHRRWSFSICEEKGSRGRWKRWYKGTHLAFLDQHCIGSFFLHFCDMELKITESLDRSHRHRIGLRARHEARLGNTRHSTAELFSVGFWDVGGLTTSIRDSKETI